MKKCNTSKGIKYFRIVVSLIIIGLGIYYKNWLGFLGIITLISAFTGTCPLTLKFNRKSDFTSK